MMDPVQMVGLVISALGLTCAVAIVAANRRARARLGGDLTARLATEMRLQEERERQAQRDLEQILAHVRAIADADRKRESTA